MQGEEIVEKEGGIGASNWLPNGGGGERLDEIGMEEKGWASTDTTKRESKKENELGRVSFNSTRRISFGWDDTSLFTHTTQKSGWGVSGCFAQLTSRFHSSLPFLYLFLQPMGPKPTSPRAQFLLALSFQPIPNWPKLWHHVFPLLLLFISMNMKWC